MRREKKKTQISFTRDIVKEVAKEMDVTERQVREIYDAQILYMRHLMENTPTVAIYIPYIGILHLKVSHVFKQLLRYSHKEEDKDKLAIYEAKKAILDEHLQDRIAKKAKGRSRHIERLKINLTAYTAGKTISEIEDIQNKR